jgi:hypothetical protein
LKKKCWALNIHHIQCMNLLALLGLSSIFINLPISFFFLNHFGNLLLKEQR